MSLILRSPSKSVRRMAAPTSIGLALLLAFGSGVRTRTTTQVLVDAPLQRIEVIVNGQGPFVFGLDTGASGEAWVTRTLADELRLPTVGSWRVSDGAGIDSRTAPRVRIDSLKIGSLSFTGILAPVLGDGPAHRTDEGTYGTLGFQLFRNYVVTFDYPAQRFRITANSLPAPDGKTILSYSLDHGSPQVAIQLGGIRMDAFIDSGSGGGIVLPRSFATQLPLRSPISLAGKVASSLNEFDLYRAELDGDFEFGGVNMHNPAIFFSDLVQQPTIGRALLRQFAVTFDQTTRRMQLQIPSQIRNDR
jgi:predicted aspartyl protease